MLRWLVRSTHVLPMVVVLTLLPVALLPGPETQSPPSLLRLLLCLPSYLLLHRCLSSLRLESQGRERALLRYRSRPSIGARVFRGTRLHGGDAAGSVGLRTFVRRRLIILCSKEQSRMRINGYISKGGHAWRCCWYQGGERGDERKVKGHW